MRTVNLTLLSSKFDTTGRGCSFDWAALAQTLSNGMPRVGQKDGDAFVVGLLTGKRSADNMASVDVLSFDLEPSVARKITSTQVMDDLLAFHRSGIEHVAWTTYSATSQELRVRVVVPLSRSIDPSTHPITYARLRADLRLRSDDPNARDVSRPHYLPAVSRPGDFFDAWHIAGKPFEPPSTIPAPMTSKAVHVRTEPVPEVHIDKVRAWVVRLPNTDVDKPSLVNVSKGMPFAQHGERHEKVVQTTWRLAGKFPGLTETQLEELYADSLTAMEQQSPHDHPTIREVLTAWRGARKRQDKDREAQAIFQLDALGLPQQAEPEHVLDRIAARHGWTLDELHKRWVLDGNSGHFVLGLDGDYVHVKRERNADLVMKERLAETGVVRVVEVVKGRVSHRKAADITMEYGTSYRDAVYDLTAQFTTYDHTSRTVRMAPCPIISQPRFHVDVDEWLKQLAGTTKPLLDDWLSYVPRLEKLLCALYIGNASGAGKTLLAHGLAKIWSIGGPSDLNKAFKGWNSQVKTCPLLFGDEKLDQVRGTTVTSRLRQEIGTVTREVHEKFLPVTQALGATRILLAANDDKMLVDPQGMLTTADRKAVHDRVLYIEAPTSAKDYLDKHVTQEQKDRWMRSGIAEHVMWLCINHKVQYPGQRFAVDGNFKQALRLPSEVEAVLELCARYLLDPQKYDAVDKYDTMRVEGGKLLINKSALHEAWPIYMHNHPFAPEPSDLRHALNSIGEGKPVVRDFKSYSTKQPGTRQRKMTVIPRELLVDFTEELGIADRKTVEGILDGTTAPPTALPMVTLAGFGGIN